VPGLGVMSQTRVWRHALDKVAFGQRCEKREDRIGEARGAPAPDGSSFQSWISGFYAFLPLDFD
jgi:hypothetical protein